MHDEYYFPSQRQNYVVMHDDVILGWLAGTTFTQVCDRTRSFRE